MRRGRKPPAFRRELAGKDELQQLLAATRRACQSKDVELIRAALAPLGWLRWPTLPAGGDRQAHAEAIGAVLRRRGVLQPRLGDLVAAAHALLASVDSSMADLRTGIQHGNRGLLLEGLARLDFDPERAADVLADGEGSTDEAWRNAVAMGACSIRLTAAESQVIREAVEAMAALPDGVQAASRPEVLASAAKSILPAWMHRLLPAGVKP